jgi:hypothetical protein
MDPSTGRFEPTTARRRLPALVPAAIVGALFAGGAIVAYQLLRSDGGRAAPATRTALLPVTAGLTTDGLGTTEEPPSTGAAAGRWPPTTPQELVALTRSPVPAKTTYRLDLATGAGSVELVRGPHRLRYHLRAGPLEAWAYYQGTTFVWGCLQGGTGAIRCTSDRAQASLYRAYQDFFRSLFPERLATEWSALATAARTTTRGNQACSRVTLGGEGFAKETCVQRSGILVRDRTALGSVRMGIVLQRFRLGVRADDFKKPVAE